MPRPLGVPARAVGCLAEIRVRCQHASLDGAANRAVDALTFLQSCLHSRAAMNPRLRYGIRHWLQALTWPASQGGAGGYQSRGAVRLSDGCKFARAIRPRSKSCVASEPIAKLIRDAVL